MKIYTKSGDRGRTALFSGERVGKDDSRVSAYGTLDELNSMLGVAAAHCREERVLEVLGVLQNELFSAGADLATRPESKREVGRVGKEDCQRLEETIDELQEKLPKLKNFILPGGSAGAAQLHLARSVCRRAERRVVSLLRAEEVNGELLVFLNRLSDLLFVLARYENIRGGGEEVLWAG